MDRKAENKLSEEHSNDVMRTGDSEDETLFVECLNATEEHLSNQPQIPNVMRTPILQAESNSRMNKGDVCTISSIDNGRMLSNVPDGFEGPDLCVFLWGRLMQAEGQSIHFAFATNDNGLCVIYMDQNEGYVARAPLSTVAETVSVGDWEITAMPKNTSADPV